MSRIPEDLLEDQEQDIYSNWHLHMPILYHKKLFYNYRD